ncbi:YjgF family protein Mmf1 [Schizosaccharomyces cryophilus OY26]|uniref:YjgF family protein Mmf1 n=1 Tax=Schizosaccharomyces cryophilus (strain OY26 / ATCC MYA-4695 / CBS 11777 / NBRC 106824 / NRRL Y48691) TaxID=653667 RepID=S9VW69_SCHCR|nr:YjgF family protein Mmf1 [Schizosaccharomyces cryophilus OY26]EPY50479.1 YjgF family protein Mmf1 [Schizosaccharomyces cryophilus OY26]
MLRNLAKSTLSLGRPLLTRSFIVPTRATYRPSFVSNMSTKTVINSPKLSSAGPYNQAIKANGTIYCSGQIPVKDGKVVEGCVGTQTRQCLSNLEEVLKEAGSGLEKIVKINIFLADMGDFATVNKAYAEVLPDPKPARSCVAVKTLPLEAQGVKIEIECIAAE